MRILSAALAAAVLLAADPVPDRVRAEAERSIERLDDPDWAVRREAMAALRDLGKPALPVLESRLPDVSAEARWRLEVVVSELKDEEWYAEGFQAIMKEDWKAAEKVLERYLEKPGGQRASRARVLLDEVRTAFLDEEARGTLSRAIAVQNLYTFFRARGQDRRKLFDIGKEEYDRFLIQEPDPKSGLLGLASLLADGGDIPGARRMEKRWRDTKAEEEDVTREGKDVEDILNEAYYRAAVGDADAAIGLLERAREANRAMTEEYFRSTDDFHHLWKRADFQELLPSDLENRPDPTTP
ncbi:MAG: hypothetical protein AAB215_00390 [Planctomycetota bacterium]